MISSFIVLIYTIVKVKRKTIRAYNMISSMIKNCIKRHSFVYYL